MEILYPKDYVVVVADKVEGEVPKSTTALKTFIKTLVKNEPMAVEEIIKSVDMKYVETADEKYHFLADEITLVCQKIDLEYRPEKDENTLPAAEL